MKINIKSCLNHHVLDSDYWYRISWWYQAVVIFIIFTFMVNSFLIPKNYPNCSHRANFVSIMFLDYQQFYCFLKTRLQMMAYQFYIYWFWSYYFRYKGKTTISTLNVTSLSNSCLNRFLIRMGCLCFDCKN